jgi:hypothetical protein
MFMKQWLGVAALCLLAAPVYAQDAQRIDRMVATAHTVFDESKIDWKDEGLLPNGAKSALIIGDPARAGVFMAYLKFPPAMSFRLTPTPLRKWSPS